MKDIPLPYRVKLETRPQAAQIKYEACRKLFTGLDIRSLFEPFGGVGIVRSALPDIVHHETWDMDQGCCDAIQTKFPDSVVRCCDSYKAPLPEGPWDLISLEFNRWTLMSLLIPESAEFINRVLKLQPRYIELTDSSISKFHLNHPAYSRRFGRDLGTFDQYAKEIARQFSEITPYTHIRTEDGGGAAYLLFERIP